MDIADAQLQRDWNHALLLRQTLSRLLRKGVNCTVTDQQPQKAHPRRVTYKKLLPPIR